MRSEFYSFCGSVTDEQKQILQSMVNESYDIFVGIVSDERGIPLEKAKEIADGHFREDLFYRLSVFHIHLPPLRERVDDIPLHVEAFVSALSSKIGKTIRTISPDYVRILKRYPWKGNVRELRNVVERSLIISDGDTLTADTLPLTIQNPQDNTDSSYSGFDLDGVEKMHIQKVLKYTNGNKTETSRLLGIGLTTLYRKIEEYGL